MRVASRRLRSALATYEPLFDPDVTRPVGQELRWLSRVLGAARDADLLRDRLTSAAAGGTDGVRPLAGIGPPVREELAEACRTAHDRVLLELGGERYRTLLVTLETLVERAPLTQAAAGPASDVLPALVARTCTALGWSMVAAQGSSDPVEREELLHDARRAAARARYAAQSVTPVFEDARALARAVDRVQEALGDHLDSSVVRRRLVELADRTTDPSTAFALGRLHALEEIRGERSAADVDAAWAAASRKCVRRWLR